ncbi:MAG: FAD-dependent oxidoreductase [Phycisphaerales bacterium]|nr:MAG: FAD-dependent oxidoreductase [Phycisphaerales bacterium]
MAGSHTVVVGGGIVGVCSAYYLARRGHRVTLLAKGTIDDTASTGNAGIVALGHLPLPRPGLAWKAVKWMFDSGSPLYIPPRLDPGLLRWLWNFRRACNPRQVDHCMKMLATLGRATIECWESIVSEQSIDCHYHRHGWMDVYRTEAGREHVRADAEVIGGYGFETEHLTGDELRKEDPAFSDAVLGAVRFPESAFLDPGPFMVALAKRLTEMGATVREETPVTCALIDDGKCSGVELAGGGRIEADTIILAAGVWTTELARAIGVRVPMQAGKGYHVDLVAPDPCVKTACVLAEAFLAVTPIGDTLRLAGTVELSGINHNLARKRLDMLKVGARKYYRGIDEARITGEWCGLRPCTADGMPVLGWAPGVEGLFIATGHARMGLTHGPITGRLASECILDGKPSLDITPMRVDRF